MMFLIRSVMFVTALGAPSPMGGGISDGWDEISPLLPSREASNTPPRQPYINSPVGKSGSSSEFFEEDIPIMPSTFELPGMDKHGLYPDQIWSFKVERQTAIPHGEICTKEYCGIRPLPTKMQLQTQSIYEWDGTIDDYRDAMRKLMGPDYGVSYFGTAIDEKIRTIAGDAGMTAMTIVPIVKLESMRKIDALLKEYKEAMVEAHPGKYVTTEVVRRWKIDNWPDVTNKEYIWNFIIILFRISRKNNNLRHNLPADFDTTIVATHVIALLTTWEELWVAASVNKRINPINPVILISKISPKGSGESKWVLTFSSYIHNRIGRDHSNQINFLRYEVDLLGWDRSGKAVNNVDYFHRGGMFIWGNDVEQLSSIEHLKQNLKPLQVNGAFDKPAAGDLREENSNIPNNGAVVEVNPTKQDVENAIEYVFGVNRGKDYYTTRIRVGKFWNNNLVFEEVKEKCNIEFWPDTQDEHFLIFMAQRTVEEHRKIINTKLLSRSGSGVDHTRVIPVTADKFQAIKDDVKLEIENMKQRWFWIGVQTG